MAVRAQIHARHNFRITKAEFSRDGEWLLTLGGNLGQQSIQLADWKDEDILTFRSIEEEQIHEIQFNPYNRREFCLAGKEILRLYELSEHGLIVQEETRVPDHTFLAITYTSSVFGSDIESDVITGS